jgi:hypothetical protein
MGAVITITTSSINYREPLMKNTILALSLVCAFGAANAAPTNAISNGSFESSNVVAGDYRYAAAIPGHLAVTASPWDFFGGAGISNSSSAWGGTALDGSSYAFLQGAGGTVSQTFYGGSGQYTIDFALAQRTTAGTVVGAQSIGVSLDGKLLTLAPQVSSPYISPTAFTSNPFTYGGWTRYSFTVDAASGSHKLAFEGQGWNGQDTSVFLDKVSVAAPVPEPETYAMLLAGLGLMGTIAARRKPKQA